MPWPQGQLRVIWFHCNWHKIPLALVLPKTVLRGIEMCATRSRQSNLRSRSETLPRLNYPSMYSKASGNYRFALCSNSFSDGEFRAHIINVFSMRHLFRFHYVARLTFKCLSYPKAPETCNTFWVLLGFRLP